MQRQLLNARIKWAEASGRHKDMLDNVRELVKEASDQGFELSPDERNFVSFAYKNVVSELRKQWRTLVQTELNWMDGYGDERSTPSKAPAGSASVSDKRSHHSTKSAHGEVKNSSSGDDVDDEDWFDIDDDAMIKKKWDARSTDQLRQDHFKEYLTSIETQLFEICNELEVTVNETLLPTTGENQGKVFFRKMLADYSRYLSEILDGEARKERAEKALMSYKLAATLADSVLNPTDPVRLGLSLNFSVFYWEIMGFKDRARQVAKAAFDDAMAELDLMGEHDHHESTLILELIRENLDLWKRHDGELVYLPGGGGGGGEHRRKPRKGSNTIRKSSRK